MKKLTVDKINTGINKIESLYLLQILDTLLQRLYYENTQIIDRDIDGIIWEINCINPYGELYPEKIL